MHLSNVFLGLGMYMLINCLVYIIGKQWSDDGSVDILFAAVLTIPMYILIFLALFYYKVESWFEK